jgi:hypothetical protein
MSITRLIPIKTDAYTIEVPHYVHVLDLVKALNVIGYTLRNTGHETFELQRTVEPKIPTLDAFK